MKWDKLDVTDCLFCREASAQEISVVERNAGAFLSGCKSKYPGVRRELEEGLTHFVGQLNAGSGAAPFLKLNAIKLMLRWGITDGNPFQDFRRDNARALWRVLFRGPLPDFYRYCPQTREYIEDTRGREGWIQAQVSRCESNLAGSGGIY